MLRRFLTAAAAVLSLATSPHFVSAQEAPLRERAPSVGDPTPVPGNAQRLVRLTTKDGVEIAAILMTPASGLNPMSPGIVFHHGGLGGHPARLIGAPRFAAERLAAKGYTTLSILSRTSNSWYNPRIEETALDIEAAIDFLAANNIDQIVLAAHSFGSIKISHYQATRQDRRVKALLHWAPTADTAEFQRARIGDAAYFARLEKASRAVGRGEGEIDLTPDPARAKGVAMEPFIDMEQQFMSARAWLEWWGPATKLRNSDRMGEIAEPMLLLSGDKDPFVPPGRLEALQQAAANSPATKYIWYKGGDHTFTGYENQSSDDAATFLAENGLAPRGAIVERLVDAKLPNERYYPAVLTTPAGVVDKNRPLFVIVHGWGGTILQSSNRWLAERLAAQGFAALAPMLRSSGLDGTTDTSLDEVAGDLGAWLNFAQAQGFTETVLIGHSMGGIWITNYLATSQDARVKGAIYLAPTRDMAERARVFAGTERYEAIVAAAQTAVAEGRGKSAWVMEKYYLPPPSPPELGIRTFWHQKAQSWLETWGPEAKTVHSERIREVRVPILAMAGSGESLVDRDFLSRFTRAARTPAQMIWYDDGTPHSFKGAEDKVTADILAWTRTQLRVR
jgi:pimeloyl-ACP methyl ester carboxylesterase